MQLDALIGDITRGTANDVLGSGQRAAAFRTVRLVGYTGREHGHGSRLIQFDVHVDHAVLQDLELADDLTELLAGLEVIKGQRTRGLHAADGFGALCSDGAALLVTQCVQCLAVHTQHSGATDKHVVEEQVTGSAAIHGRVLADADTRARRIDQEQADASFVAFIAGDACRYQNQTGALPAHHQRLVPREGPATVHRHGAGLHVVQLVMALRLVDSHRQLQLRIGDLRQQFAFLRRTAELLDQPAGENHRVQPRLKTQAAPQFLGNQHHIDAIAAKATVGFGKWHRGQAQFAQLLPELATEALCAFAELLAVLETIGVANQSGSGVLQHLLLF
ncbi:hypothetical protein D3C71_978830 [compost metagenome]